MRSSQVISSLEERYGLHWKVEVLTSSDNLYQVSSFSVSSGKSQWRKFQLLSYDLYK